MSTSWAKRFDQDWAEDEEIRGNETAELRVASREPGLRELVEIVAAQNEQIAALNAKVAQLTHAIGTMHLDDKRRHRETLREIDALRHSLSEPAVPTLGNMGRGSWLPKQIPTASYGIRRRGSWPSQAD